MARKYLNAVDLVGATAAQVGDPPSGTRRFFTDSATGKLSVRTSTPATISLEEQGGAAAAVARYYPIMLTTPQQQSNKGNTWWGIDQPGANVDQGAWFFKRNTLAHWFGSVLIPATLGATPAASITLIWDINITTGNVQWQVGTARWASGAAHPTSYTNETAQTITVPGTARFQARTRFPATGNLGVTPQAGDLLMVDISQLAASTAAMEAVLHMAYLEVAAT